MTAVPPNRKPPVTGSRDGGRPVLAQNIQPSTPQLILLPQDRVAVSVFANRQIILPF
jgi:hypothetical protein